MDALELATYHGKAAIFRELIQHLPYINPQKQKVLLTYAQGEMISVITKELPEHIAQKNEALDNHWSGGSAAHMLALLRSGANPNLRDFLCVPLITRQDSLASLKILLRQGADANAYIPTLDHNMAKSAMYRDEPKRLKILLEHGADHNCKDGRPLAHIAISWEQPQSLQVLLEHGANPNATWGNRSLLRWAELSEQKKELVPLLKKYRAHYTTLEKYPEIINVPLSIAAGLLVTKAVGNQITASSVAGIASVSVLTNMVMRAIRHYRYENN
jgi:ankyrin repeat protein